MPKSFSSIAKPSPRLWPVCPLKAKLTGQQEMEGALCLVGILDRLTDIAASFAQSVQAYSGESKAFQKTLQKLNEVWTLVSVRTPDQSDFTNRETISEALYLELNLWTKQQAITITGLTPSLSAGQTDFTLPDRSAGQSQYAYTEVDLTAIKAAFDRLGNLYSDRLTQLQSAVRITLQTYQANLGLVNNLQSMMYERNKSILMGMNR